MRDTSARAPIAVSRSKRRTRCAVAAVIERSNNPVSHTVTVYIENDAEDEAAAELAEFLAVHTTPAYAGFNGLTDEAIRYPT